MRIPEYSKSLPNVVVKMFHPHNIAHAVLCITAVFVLSACTPEDPKCRVETRWDRHTPIVITQPLRWYPSDADELNCMIPGSRIAFQVKSADEDLLVQHCKDECVGSSGDHFYPLPDTARIQWDVNGGGSMQQAEGETVFYKLPNGAGIATLHYQIDTPGDKATDDDSINGTATITTRVKPDSGCLEVEITPQAPNQPAYATEFQNSTAPICKPDPLVWEANAAIQGTLAVSNPLCPRATVLLSSDFSDKDKLKLACDSDDCERDEKEIPLSDVLTATWDDGGAGGSFPFGNTGKQVIYTVPDAPGPIQFTVSADDSGRQHDDAAGSANQQDQSRQLFDLTHINSTASNPFKKNFTTGKNLHFKPEWNPANADVRKILWETDLGGATGELKRKKCSSQTMTSPNVDLKFNNRRRDQGLDVSWREHSHQHNEKSLEVQAWAQRCGDACFCDDSTWENSNFLTGNDHDKFKLFSDHDENRDDGRVENLTTVNADDKWGERTSLRGVNVPNWFVHWSSRTYAASSFDHAQTTPPLKYRANVAWLGLYDRNRLMIYLSEEAAEQSDRPRFHGNGWFVTSEDKHYKASNTQQRTYDLVGHQLATKVYLHETAHYEAISANWKPTGAWRRAYGPRSSTESQVNSWRLAGPLPRITVAIAAVGNFNGQREHNKDFHQKFDVTLEFNIRGTTGIRTIARVIPNAWFTSPQLTATDTSVQGVFELYTQSEHWRYRNAQVIKFQRPNDPDDDFLPNAIEDQIGTSWDTASTHPTHARYNPPVGINRRDYRPDQEYWADHKVLGSGTDIVGLTDPQWAAQIKPGPKDNDWANPGAQSDPPAR
jgi:hypothetical protein